MVYEVRSGGDGAPADVSPGQETGDNVLYGAVEHVVEGAGDEAADAEQVAGVRTDVLDVG